jgi:hypothetical protein
MGRTKVIYLRYGIVTEIAKTLGCNRNTVSTALRKNAPCKKAEKIRTLIIENEKIMFNNNLKKI